MLWLTGVLGAMVVGAVAFLDLAPVEQEEGDTHLDDFLDEHGPAGYSDGAQADDPGSLDLRPTDLVALSASQGQTYVLTTSSVQMIEAFDPETDDLVVVWDDSAGDEPDVRLAHNDDDPDHLELWAGTDLVARAPIGTGLTAERVALIPLSAAQDAGWVPDPAAPPKT